MKNLSEQDFAKHYNAVVQESERRFYRPVRIPLAMGTSDPSAVIDHRMTAEILRGVDVSLSEEDYVRLVTDAEEGRSARYLRAAHPALLEAWDQYRVLLELTRRGPL